MKNFIKPVNGGQVSYRGDKKMIISSFNGDRVLSTYDGIITESDPTQCGGFIQIEHDINNKAHFSNYCNVGRIMIGRRVPVRQGETIGYVGDDNLEYEIFNSNGHKQSLHSFFTIKNNDKDDKTKKEKPKEVKTPEIKTSKQTYFDKLNSSEPGLHSLTKNLIVAPFHVTDFIGKKVKQGINKLKSKKDEENEQKVNEEIDRIKQLLK